MTRNLWNGYMPSIGIVVTTIGKIDGILNAWLPLLKESPDCIDFCIVESGVDKETSFYNRNLCLNENIKRHWVPKNGKWGKSDARNYGASKVNGEYLWFVDGDCYPNQYAINNMRKYANPEAIICGRIRFPQPTGEQWDDHRMTLMDGRGVTATHYMWAVGEGNMCYPRRLFDSVGGFDVSWAESGWCPEGTDLYWRIFCRHFTPLLLVPAITVTHQYHPPSEERQRAQATGENIEPLKRRLQQTAMDAGIWEHPKVQEMFLAVQGELLDGR